MGKSKEQKDAEAKAKAEDKAKVATEKAEAKAKADAEAKAKAPKGKEKKQAPLTGRATDVEIKATVSGHMKKGKSYFVSAEMATLLVKKGVAEIVEK